MVQLATSSKDFNRLWGGFPRGGVCVLHVGCGHEDIFRLALLKLFTTSTKISVLDLQGDYSGALAKAFGLVSNVTVARSKRWQEFFPTLTSMVKAVNVPDVVIINDMDSLMEANPNMFRRMIAIVKSSKTAVIVLVPKADKKDPRTHRTHRMVSRLELSVAMVMEVTAGDIVGPDFVFHIGVTHLARAKQSSQKVAVTLPYKEVSPQDRRRAKDLPGRVISRGHFKDKGVLAHQEGMAVESQDESVQEHPLEAPGTLKEKRVGGASNLSEDPAEMLKQLEGKDLSTEDFSPPLSEEPVVDLLAGVEVACTHCNSTDVKRVSAVQEVTEGSMEAMFLCLSCKKQFRFGLLADAIATTTTADHTQTVIRNFPVVRTDEQTMGEQLIEKPGEGLAAESKRCRKKPQIDRRTSRRKTLEVVRDSSMLIASGDAEISGDGLGSLNPPETEKGNKVQMGPISMEIVVGREASMQLNEEGTTKPRKRRSYKRRTKKQKEEDDAAAAAASAAAASSAAGVVDASGLQSSQDGRAGGTVEVLP